MDRINDFKKKEIQSKIKTLQIKKQQSVNGIRVDRSRAIEKINEYGRRISELQKRLYRN